MLFRLIKFLAQFVFVLVLVALAAGAWLFWRAMPAYSGTAALPGLTAEARVWRDQYGVPHIFAATMNDAARALGWLHASERLYQMEIQRRVGQGRIAEIAGPDLIGVDRFIRTLGLYRLAESSFAALSPFAQARLQAYVDGVNAFLDAHADALPPEFMILSDKPEPWKPADSLVWGKLIALQLGHNYKFEIMRAELARKLPPAQASWILPMPPADSPVTTLPALHSRHAAADGPDARLGELFPFRHGASNEWVVAGSRTMTRMGAPLLRRFARTWWPISPVGAVMTIILSSSSGSRPLGSLAQLGKCPPSSRHRRYWMRR